MGKFKFRLQSYLNLKEKMEDQKKMEYGKALVTLETEKNIKLNFIADKEESIKNFKEQINKKINPLDFQMYNYYIELKKKKIIEQTKIVEKTEKYAEEKRLELVTAVKEQKTLNKLKEKAQEEHFKEELLKESKMSDEIVSYKFNKANSEN